MPYSIHEGVENREKQLKAERAIAERFPDARLWDRIRGEPVWASELAIAHVTDLDLIVGNKGDIYVYTYLDVEGMRLYARRAWVNTSLVWLNDLKYKFPDAYKAMVEAAHR